MTADPAGWPDDVREAVARALRKRSTGLEVAKWQSWLPEADAALEATRPFVAASVAAAAEAMREACAQLAERDQRTDLARTSGYRPEWYRHALYTAMAIRALPIPSADALARRDGWQPIETAPKDGTRLLLWCVHAHAEFSDNAIAEGWAAAVIGEWIDHNGGGWTWHGLCGRMTHWQPLPEPPVRARAVGEERQG